MASAGFPSLEELVYLCNPPPLPSVEDATIRFMIEKLPLQWLVQQTLIKYGGKLSWEGHRGKGIMPYLYRNAQQWREQYETHAPGAIAHAAAPDAGT